MFFFRKMAIFNLLGSELNKIIYPKINLNKKVKDFGILTFTPLIPPRNKSQTKKQIY